MYCRVDVDVHVVQVYVPVDVLQSGWHQLAVLHSGYLDIWLIYYRVEVEMISPTCPLTLGSHPQVCCTLPGSEGAETVLIFTLLSSYKM